MLTRARAKNNASSSNGGQGDQNNASANGNGSTGGNVSGGIGNGGDGGPPPPLKPNFAQAPTPPPDDPDNCCICISPVKNRCTTNGAGCRHQFCYQCLFTWSKTKAECPLCKVKFTSISYNYGLENGIEVHDEYEVPVVPPEPQNFSSDIQILTFQAQVYDRISSLYIRYPTLNGRGTREVRNVAHETGGSPTTVRRVRSSSPSASNSSSTDDASTEGTLVTLGGTMEDRLLIPVQGQTVVQFVQSSQTVQQAGSAVAENEATITQEVSTHASTELTANRRPRPRPDSPRPSTSAAARAELNAKKTTIIGPEHKKQKLNNGGDDHGFYQDMNRLETASSQPGSTTLSIPHSGVQAEAMMNHVPRKPCPARLARHRFSMTEAELAGHRIVQGIGGGRGGAAAGDDQGDGGGGNNNIIVIDLD